MAKQGIWIGAALVACALTVFFFIDGRSGSATKHAKRGVAATLDPVAKDPVAKDPVAKDDPASDAPIGFEILELELPEYDPKTNLTANRGKGRKARTKLEWIRTNFRKDRELRITMAKSLVKVPGSSESVVDPWPSPMRNLPPFLGVAAAIALPAMVVARATVVPSAVARPMNSRREIFPSSRSLA